jgi:hypothetical protein
MIHIIDFYGIIGCLDIREVEVADIDEMIRFDVSAGRVQPEVSKCPGR